MDVGKELGNYINLCKKKTPVKVNLKLKKLESLDNFEWYGEANGYVVFGEYEEIADFIETNKDKIESYRYEFDRRKSSIPLADYSKINARIEPGAIVREKVKIGDDAIILMGAIVNIGAEIGRESMIDMNSVIGSKVIIGERVHVGAGAVISGVLEPQSAEPCRVGNDAFIGANSVILEGIKIGNNAVVAAGAVVCNEVKDNEVVAGVPAKVIKVKDSITTDKLEFAKCLR